MSNFLQVQQMLTKFKIMCFSFVVKFLTGIWLTLRFWLPIPTYAIFLNTVNSSSIPIPLRNLQISNQGWRFTDTRWHNRVRRLLTSYQNDTLGPTQEIDNHIGAAKSTPNVLLPSSNHHQNSMHCKWMSSIALCNVNLISSHLFPVFSGSALLDNPPTHPSHAQLHQPRPPTPLLSRKEADNLDSHLQVIGWDGTCRRREYKQNTKTHHYRHFKSSWKWIRVKDTTLNLERGRWTWNTYISRRISYFVVKQVGPGIICQALCCRISLRISDFEADLLMIFVPGYPSARRMQRESIARTYKVAVSKYLKNKIKCVTFPPTAPRWPRPIWFSWL